MTDNEIIKALEERADFDCKRCSFNDENCSGEECEVVICRNALVLINRLQADKDALIAGQETLQKALAEKNAEVERLQKENVILSANAENAFQEGLNESRELFKQEVEAQIKAEAVKEFAEVFKVKFAKEQYRDNYVIDDEMLDNLVKEMVGDTE